MVWSSPSSGPDYISAHVANQSKNWKICNRRRLLQESDYQVGPLVTKTRDCYGLLHGHCDQARPAAEVGKGRSSPQSGMETAGLLPGKQGQKLHALLAPAAIHFVTHYLSHANPWDIIG